MPFISLARHMANRLRASSIPGLRRVLANAVRQLRDAGETARDTRRYLANALRQLRAAGVTRRIFTAQLNTEVAYRVFLQERLREQQAQLDHARAENADLRARLLRAPPTPSPDDVETR
jgi:conjugal transfer/entry exclusion protein